MNLLKEQVMATKKRHYFVAALISILLSFGNIALAQTVAPNPQTILKRMIARYESVSSYQDSGIVRVLPGDPTLIAGSESHRFQAVMFRDETLVSFKIYYARPRKFRFEWKSFFLQASRDAAIWSDRKQAYSWMPNVYPRNDGFTLSNRADLRFYIEEAKGLSGGAVFLVPSLVMNDVSYFSFADMVNAITELSLIREEQFDGELCYVIKGKMYGTPWVLWVGKNSHLLRKTRTLYTGGSFHEKMEKGIRETLMLEELHRDIKINVKISEKAFEYKPQVQAHDSDLTR